MLKKKFGRFSSENRRDNLIMSWADHGNFQNLVLIFFSCKNRKLALSIDILIVETLF